MMIEFSAMTTEHVVGEVMRIHKSLPARPGIEEVVAARSLIENVEREDQLKLEGIMKQNKGKDVPEELFRILQETQRNMIHFQSKEQKKEAQKLLDLEGVHLLFDDLIQRASECLKSYSASQNSKSKKNTSSSSLAISGAFSTNNLNSTITETSVKSSLSSGFSTEESVKASEALLSKDDSYLKKPKTSFHLDSVGVKVRSGDVLTVPLIVDSTLKPAITHGEFDIICWIGSCNVFAR